MSRHNRHLSIVKDKEKRDRPMIIEADPPPSTPPPTPIVATVGRLECYSCFAVLGKENGGSTPVYRSGRLSCVACLLTTPDRTTPPPPHHTAAHHEGHTSTTHPKGKKKKR